MKKYRFVYWFGSITTECYINANSQEEAIELFKEKKGDMHIVNIEEG